MKTMKLTLLFASLFAAALWGCGSNKGSDGAQTTAATPEDAIRATAFVGADRCGGCHEATHAGWAATAHTQKLRDGALEVNYSNDGNGSGRSDFFDAAEVDVRDFDGAANKYDAYGTNAPILGSDGGGAYVKIGAAKYYVVFAMGGSATHAIAESDLSDINGDGLILNDEAQWKQRYVTKIGNSHYILPVQFNQQSGEYTTYDTDKWYDASNLPLEKPSNNNSYERRCAGCHLTGLELALQGDEWTMNFSDMSVACEACHGPGGQHATAPTKNNIINPATMTTTLDLNADGSVDQVDNLIMRNNVCYNCHSRGAGKYTANGTTVDYASKAGPNGEVLLYLPGLDWKEYYDISEKSSDYWGGTPTTTDFITSKSHHQQQQDLAFGPHGPDKSYDHECFVCHNMHSTANEDLVVSEVMEDGIRIAIDTAVSTTGAKNNRNNLCLSCHAGYGDFADLTVIDVSSGSANVEAISKAHMAKRAAKSRVVDGVKSMFACTSCHMPKTAKSAVWTQVGTGVLDANGNEIMETTKGDISSHVLTIVWPSLSETNAGMPNACNSCHNGDSTAADPAVSNKTAGTAILRDWAKSAHGDETGEAWKHYDWDEGDAATSPGSRQSCQKCHTATGAMNFFADPANYDAANNEFNLPEGKNQVLYCYGCHSETAQLDGFGTLPHAPGAITADYDKGYDATLAPVKAVFPDADSSNICVMCHAGRSGGQKIADATSIPTGNFGSYNPHYLAAAGVLYNTIGYEFSGQDYANVGFFAHDGIGAGTTGPCVACHMDATDPAIGTHNYSVFQLDATGAATGVAAVCGTCHGAMTLTTIETEHDGFQDALVLLTDVLATKGIFYNAASGYPYVFNTAVAADQSFGTAFAAWPDKDTLGATFNLALLDHEQGAFAHNRFYTKRLIFDSIDFLDNGVLDGTITIDAATYPEAATWLGTTRP